jgi:hypothetical protein
MEAIDRMLSEQTRRPDTGPVPMSRETFERLWDGEWPS